MSRVCLIKVLSLISIYLIGCANGSAELPNRRGIAVPPSDAPDAVIQEFHRRDTGKVRRIENINRGSLFRIEADSRAVFLIDYTGAWIGTVI